MWSVRVGVSTVIQVESLTSARKSAMSGSEPSDAIRVVNALLTQIDQIKRYPNVLILTTSNVTGAIDLAFVDRWRLCHPSHSLSIVSSAPGLILSSTLDCPRWLLSSRSTTRACES